jgi:hypothetical protein
MNLKNIGYAFFIATSAAAFVIGSGGPTEAKAKKMAPPPPHAGPCFEIASPVCGVKGGMKFTYANACFAAKDGANVVSQGACPAKKAMKHHKKAGKKKAAKPEKKMEKKSDMKKPAAPAKKADEKKKM